MKRPASRFVFGAITQATFFCSHMSMDASQQASSKEGYLTKRGHVRKNWTLRWFVFADAKIKYFKKREVCIYCSTTFYIHLKQPVWTKNSNLYFKKFCRTRRQREKLTWQLARWLSRWATRCRSIRTASALMSLPSRAKQSSTLFRQHPKLTWKNGSVFSAGLW